MLRDAADVSIQDPTGRIVAGRYRIERQIGAGGMGSVWAGRHVSLDQLVAVKFIHPGLATSADALRRFDTEAKAAARIRSRHAVSVFDHGITERGDPYIVMEYLDGESLEQAIRRRGRLPFAEVAAIVEQAARALAAAHESGIVHRDLKPDNVFLARDPDAVELGYAVKLVDFGIAKLLEDEARSGAAKTQAGTVLGTPHYMSPEALTASLPVGPASDVWSLGACAFAAATGRVPFEGDAIGDVVLKVCAAPLPRPTRLAPELPRAFDTWFLRACSRDIAARFASASDAARALGDLSGWERRRREESAYELRRSESEILLSDLDEPRTSRRGLLLGGVLAGAATMLALLGYYVVDRTREADAAVAAMAASANAIIEAENRRRLEAANAKRARRADAGAADHGADPGSAGEPPPKKPPPSLNPRRAAGGAW